MCRYLVFLFYSCMAVAQFNPITLCYNLVTADFVDMAYLEQSNFLLVPQVKRPPQLLTLSNSIADIKESSAISDEELYKLYNMDYSIIPQQYTDCHTIKTRSGLEKVTPELQQKRQISFNEANKILALFLKEYPDLRPKLESSVAYGVFEIVSFNTLIYAGGFGTGMIFDNVEKSTRYVDTFRAGTGLGLGYISNYTLIIFHKHFALDQYFGAGGAGGDVGGSGTIGIWNRSLSFNPTISTYHIFHYGANLQVNWGATLYWLSPILN
jgi:hypothetical protein